MITLQITGTNYKEIKTQLYDLVNDMALEEDVKSEVTFIPPVNESTGRVPSFSQPAPFVAATPLPAAPTRAKRRSKAEIEAERVAKLQAAQAEVANAQASHQAPTPITIPQVPTTNHVVNIPQEQPAPVQQAAPVIQPPVQQVQAPAGAYTLDTFKQNLVMILNSLLSTGKLNSAWISDTANQIFGGADIWLWSQNEAKIAELFQMFIQWEFIQEFKG